MTEDKKTSLQEVGQMASEINRLASSKTDDFESTIEECRELINQMDDKLPDN